MPFISLQTNQEITPDKESILRDALADAISLIPGKSSRWLMLRFEDRCRMAFHGETDAPMAMVQVKLFGDAEHEDTDRLSGALCQILENTLAIDPAYVYVKYEMTDHWGWNGSNF